MTSSTFGSDCHRFDHSIRSIDPIGIHWLPDLGKKIVETLVQGLDRLLWVQCAHFNFIRPIDQEVALAASYEYVMSERGNYTLRDDVGCTGSSTSAQSSSSSSKKRTHAIDVLFG